jgi:protein-S-isoprenylcysteine O-methyltransferase Ste14
MNQARLNFFFEKTSNLVAALIYGWMAYRMGVDWLTTGRLSSLFFLALESVILVLFLIRNMPKEANHQPYDWFIALMATALPMLLRPAATIHDTLLLLTLQVAGASVAIIAVLFLNKSFGIVPANRGVKRGGIYRYVRHPIYAGYMIAYTAFILQNPTRNNITIALIFMVFIVLRIYAEEKLLARDPAYADYMKQTRWRLLPGVF